MNTILRVLSEEELSQIHKESVRILEEVGVRVPSEKALSLLEKEGAEVLWDEKIVKFPQALIEKTLKQSPKSFTLGARCEDHNVLLPGLSSSINLDGMGTRVIDFNTGERRGSLLSDIENAARVFERMKAGTVLWPPLVAHDVPQGAAGFLGAATCYINSGKHIQDEVKKVSEVYYVKETVKAILGGEEKLKERMLYSATYCTVAPLSHDLEMLEATMALTKMNSPILMYPMPASGSTGPAGLFNNVAVANAEVLSCVAIFQTVTPNTPLIYGAAVGSIDRSTGRFLEGAPETALQLTCMNQMGKYYGFPTIVAGCLTDAADMGFQAALEKLMNTLPLVLTGCDVVQGAGFLESSMTMTLEQILMDGEILELSNRFAKGVTNFKDEDMFEEIKKVGPGGHFLKQKSTRELFRSDEYYTPKLMNRDTYDTWIKIGSPTMITNARKRVAEILDEGIVDPLPIQTEKVIRDIMEEAKAKL